MVGASAAKKIFRCIIMGAPGSGKGTISNRIVKDFGFKHISSGDIMRKNIVDQTNLGKEIKPYLDKGELVPDKLTCQMVTVEVNGIEKMNQSWLLDGFPRSTPQAKELEKQLAGKKVDTVLSLNVPFDIIVQRMSSRYTHLPSGRIYNLEFNPPKVPGKDDVTGEALVQREDDKAETVRKRLDTYQNYTAPVLAFYKSQGIAVEFRGKYSNEIWPHVWKYLNARFPAKQYTDYGTGK